MSASHTLVHRVARRFLEPTQDVLVLGIAVALFGLMVRTLGRLFAVVTAFLVGLGTLLRFGDLRVFDRLSTERRGSLGAPGRTRRREHRSDA